MRLHAFVISDPGTPRHVNGARLDLSGELIGSATAATGGRRAAATDVGSDGEAPAGWVDPDRPARAFAALDLVETEGTAAVRMPAHPVVLELLAETGPLAVSSANLTGTASPQTCQAAKQMLGTKVAVYLDAGPTPAAVASTIVNTTGAVPILVRAGAISTEELRTVILDCTTRPARPSRAPPAQFEPVAWSRWVQTLLDRADSGDSSVPNRNVSNIALEQGRRLGCSDDA
ncbi:L-threonylcarbamoyladenylate synthase [Nocardia sp. NPDC056064]|uniref:L-threonylcarbamoyladenylate synthase n=1 Tax=Nocardia sp. NPDC056064 TaxID=3345701 RepID=UPI0035E03248